MRQKAMGRRYALMPRALSRCCFSLVTLPPHSVIASGAFLFNDRYGHDLGDRFLIEFGRRLIAATRSDETCVRYGGSWCLRI